ncbi:putative lyase [compost metagenome]
MSKEQWTTEKLFSRLQNNKSKKSYWDYITILRQRTTKEVFEKSVQFAQSKNPKEKIIGIDVLAQLGIPPRPFQKQTIKLFFELLETENNTKVLKSLLIAIGHNNENLTNKQIGRLAIFSTTKNPLIKEGLVFSLLMINHPKAIESLITLSSDKLNHIRDWATFGLGTQIDEDNLEIRNALWKRVTDKHQETKLEAILGLAKRKDERIKPIIVQELLNGEYGVVLFEAIEEIGDKENLNVLKAYYKSEKSNKKIPKDWLDDLKSCIKNLEKKLKKSKMI